MKLSTVAQDKVRATLLLHAWPIFRHISLILNNNNKYIITEFLKIGPNVSNSCFNDRC